ncbi:MAG: ArnT family glycosyltransferase [Acidimicrobiales bacterium]|jgi:4-amino-4-deoxy-L-arabinose transferase-like glycosyltransferase
MPEATVTDVHGGRSPLNAEATSWEPSSVFGATKRFWYALLAVTGVALGVRVIYATLWQWHRNPGMTDTYYYRLNALDFAKGTWRLSQSHQSSNHPPFFSFVLSSMDIARLMTYGEQLIFVAVIGTLVVAATGLIGRQIGGDRTGLIAAGLGAIYPGFWLQGSTIMPEPLSMLLVALATALAYSLIKRPTLSRAAWVGVACGLATLTRSELVLLVPLAVWPFIAWLRELSGRQRVKLAASTTAAMIFVMTPWMVSNVIRFHDPNPLSSQGGGTLAGSNCPSTYYGPLTGYWSIGCTKIPAASSGEVATYDIAATRKAEDFALTHVSRIPAVIWAREGRVWGFYDPSQQAQLNKGGEDTWNLTAARAQVWCQYVLLALAIVGIFVLRRKKVPLSPLVGVIVLVVLVVAMFYGEPRFTSSAQVAFVVLSGAALDAGWSRVHLFGRRR